MFILRKRILENENGNAEHHIILGVFETKDIAVDILKKHGNEKIEMMNNEYTYVIRDNEEENAIIAIIELEEVELNKMIEILL